MGQIGLENERVKEIDINIQAALSPQNAVCEQGFPSGEGEGRPARGQLRMKGLCPGGDFIPIAVVSFPYPLFLLVTPFMIIPPAF